MMSETHSCRALPSHLSSLGRVNGFMSIPIASIATDRLQYAVRLFINAALPLADYAWRINQIFLNNDRCRVIRLKTVKPDCEEAIHVSQKRSGTRMHRNRARSHIGNRHNNSAKQRLLIYLLFIALSTCASPPAFTVIESGAQPIVSPLPPS